jgi:hypothetical protein
MTVSILKCEEEIMWAFLLVAILVAYMILKRREKFVLKYGNPFDGEDILSFDRDAKGTRLFSTTPDTCPLDKPVLDAGLCYVECDEGYHGVGPVCWASSENVGIGTIPGIEWYFKDIISWGVHGCNGPKKDKAFWGYHDCYKWRIPLPKQVCYPGPEEETDPDGKKVKKEKENKDGLCYYKCPKRLPDRIPGMPYLCAKLSRGLAYGRGVGTVPPLFHFGA